MNLSHGRPILAIPGPSMIPDRVLQAMHIPSPNIYEGELIDITYSISADLCRLARTEGRVGMYIGNGHAAWEASLVNTLAPGDRALVISTGRFALGWAEIARKLGVEVEILDFGTDRAADPVVLEARLRRADAAGIKAVLTTQTDTASSATNDIPALRAAIDAAGHDALFLVDGIASFGCEPFEMDAWGADVLVASCQKGLMTPAGMSFVFAGTRALEARKGLERVSPYFDWAPRFAPELFYQNFSGTPPTHHLFGLRTALDMIFEEGVEQVWARHAVLASAVWAAVDVWSETSQIACNIADPAQRSRAVTTVRAGQDHGARLRAWCEQKAGLTLGIGLGLDGAATPPGEGLFRIGHMGHLNAPSILGTIGTIDAGLKALGLAHGGGALRAASDVIAEALAA
ncbi:pyridoxal-phosphate-dependent aminotransferase family protein [Oceanibium sediminis]|uniref:pyridoxal-phosphate-dependent aminotransferase family protein n=1 Tax=Oceanibium sediminis TaxID=2026339 RepID=UPI0018E5A65B|nr:aminotransferase class V-fold PLP-dependent enzyme [Oceanibium sediminis]